jgi:hypothetical protein
MNCRSFCRILEDYLEGGLDFPSRFAMEKHTRQCFSCERRLAAALHLKKMAKSLDRVCAPEGFERALLDRIREEKPAGRFGKFRDWWLFGPEGFSRRATAVAALVTLLVAGSITYWHFGARIRQPQQAQVEKSGSIPQNAKAVSSEDAARIALSRMGIPDLDVVKFDGLGHGKWVIPYMDPADGDFVEVPVPVSGDLQLILKLPKTIRMRYTQPSREYFIRTASH